jgi:hypothetical protein
LEKLVKSYPWNEQFNNIKEFGSRFVDNKKSFMTSRWQGDSHAVVQQIGEDYVPKWLSDIIPCKIQIIKIFAIEPNSVGIIHKDGINSLCAFNVPIVNTDNSTMDWFDPTEYSDLPTSYHIGTGINVRLTNEQLLIGKEIETTPYFSKKINSPSLVNINEFHRVDNRKSDQYRWVVSLRFDGNPTFDYVKKIFDEKFT